MKTIIDFVKHLCSEVKYLDSRKDFIYRDVDYFNSPSGWLEAKLHNRLREGFEAWRDEKKWRGEENQSPH